MTKFKKITFTDKQQNQGIQLANVYKKLPHQLIKTKVKLGDKTEHLAKLESMIAVQYRKLQHEETSYHGSRKSEDEIKLTIKELKHTHDHIEKNGVADHTFDYKINRSSVELGLDMLTNDYEKADQKKHNIKIGLQDETVLDETLQLDHIEIELNGENVLLVGSNLPKLSSFDLIKSVLSALCIQRVKAKSDNEYGVLIQHMTSLSFKVENDVLLIKNIEFIDPLFVMNTPAITVHSDSRQLDRMVKRESFKPPLKVNHSALSSLEKAEIIMKNDALAKAELLANQYKADNTRVKQY